MKYIKLLIIACCFVTGVSGLVWSQSGNPSTSGKFVLKNDAGNTLTLAVPSTGLVNYMLTFPPAVGASGSLPYLTNSTGSLGWTTPGTNGQVLTIVGGIPAWANASTGGGGTVTSVGLSMPSIFTVSGSPVTTSGTLTATLANENANLVFAGPPTGAAATPTFRALSTSDIPNLSNYYIVNGTSLQTANFHISGNGEIESQLQLKGTGTGVTTFQAGAQGATNINYTLPITAPTAGQILSSNASGVLSWINQSNGGGGTVTSVGLSMPSIFTVSGSPVTTSGTLTASLANESANLVFAGPTTGSPATPTFRALTSSDIPNLSNSYIVNGTTLQTANFNISGNGDIGGLLQFQGTGTGVTTFQAGAQGATNINYTLPIIAPTAGQILSSNASGVLSWINQSNGGGGTVTSVGLSMPSIFTVSGSPVTTSGTLTASLANEAANLVFAGPTTGSPATPTFRALTSADIPNLSNSYIVNGTTSQTANFNITGNGEIESQLQLKGTGAGLTTFQAGAQGVTNINYTLPIIAPTAGQILSSNASGVLSWINPANGGGGTVTSVGLSLPSIFTVTGSPVTTSGTLTGTLANENANFVFAGPVSGAAGVPTFRALLPGDFNNSAWTITGNSGTIPGTNFAGTTDSVAFEIHVNNNGSPNQGDGRVMKYIPNATSANILGGYNGNTISSTIYGATISGGGSNGNIQNILNIYGTIGGGMGNLVCGNYGIIGGGKGNISGGLVSAVLGGESNTANGIGSAISGGRELLLGDYSFGYNGESGATLTNLSAMSNIAYFGNVDLIIGNVNGTARSLRFYEPNASATYTGANYTSFTAQAQEHNINYTLPATQGAAGTVLQNNGSGILSWTDQSAQVGGVRFAIKDSDQTISSSTTLTNDNDLYFTIGASETWELITQMDVVMNAADSDAYRFKVAVTIPSGTLHVYASVTNGDGDDDCGGWLTASGTAQPNAFEINGGDDKGPVLLQGIIVGGTTGGTVHIQWAPSKNMTKTMTVKKNSYLKATKAR